MIEREPGDRRPHRGRRARRRSRGTHLRRLEVIVHFDDLPDSDITIVDGIPCTTALRTVIDLAAEWDEDQLDRVVRDCLQRGLFTIEEAQERLSRDDMRGRPGAAVLRRYLAR